MSLQASAAPFSLENAKHDTNRRSANYHPSVWGDYFLSYASDHSVETDDRSKLLELKEEIKRMLIADVNKTPAQKLDLVDAIQRLGVSYHFRSEIDAVLEKVHQAHRDNAQLRDEHNDLFSTALEFRLLRQHGYKVSCDVLNKFKDDSGNFRSSLAQDIRGMLSLYEATHLRIHGEDTLDEALAFTTTHLESLSTQLSPPLAAQVSRALDRPIRKNLPRLYCRYYMDIYQEEPLRNEVLLTFAKIDFNLLQELHQKELGDITRWWKDLDFANKLPFARDRVVECYFWILGVYFEPEFMLARRISTKVIALTSIIDDIYDVYGTIEELELFTSAIERWEVSAIDELPEYMKLCYGALLDVYSEIEKDMAYQGTLYRLHYAKEAMKTLVRNYFYEAKWCHQKHVPTMEEYMSVALVTTAYSMLATTSFVGMGDIVTKESFEWLFSNPKMIKASSIICRLMDDMVNEMQNELEREHVATSIECFMKQHGVGEEEARNVLQKQVTDAWKDINEECLHPTALPMPLLERVLNLARVIAVIYKNEDGYTNSNVMLKNFVTSLLITPVPL